ncbi:uncharacterized protein SRS1_15292 [Sporisorium reilianum f. sp. reilianum]|uniref:DNA replication regulator Sld3 C-terminal domain-containing protein n=1 Tax=Sporisorium reilianum f. sp. reilianum TaxID=72559 RepID=A0A2N8UK52_9BASI|nr:uncharacterized protein SRS1_15292 [Sporisorium reilianum f. sp. reilianum]
MALTVSSDGSGLDLKAGPSRLVALPSAPLTIRYACHLEQPEGDSWFVNPDKTASASASSCQAEGYGTGPHQSLADRYAETLWLGEHHTGLAHFLNCIDRLKLSHDLDDMLLGLCQLIKSNGAISRRHRALTQKVLPDPDNRDDLTATAMHELSEYEITLAQRVVGTAASGLRSTGLESLRERWIASMESREIQLQVLITMCLLHIVSQDPRALESARSRLRGESSCASVNETLASSEVATAGEAESEQPRKRSRKLEKAKRWRGTRPHSGSSDAFAWNQQVHKRLATDSSHDDMDSAEAEVLETEGKEVLAADHLSKRLEALVDILCLRQVAAGVGSEMADLLSDLGTETMEQDKQSQAASKAKGTLFGSSLRKLVEDDDMDDAQWLCSKVVEPHFEASLPRQCSLFRSKCFVSLQSRTPARPSKSVRTGSAGSPPVRAGKRNASLAATAAAMAVAGLGNASIAGAGLSDVLEKEQAGRRVKRNILAERSSMLGRGREVDMGRRLSRSVSATAGPGHEVRAPTGVFSRSNTNAAYTQPTSMISANTLKSGSSLEQGRSNGRYASQGVESLASSQKMQSPALAAMPSFGPPFTSSASSFASNGSKRLLVMSTPQKQSAHKTHNMEHLSQLDKPRLVYPRNSLVMESPTQAQDGSQLLRARSRIAERCASFAGRSSFALNRSPSPVAFHSDADD